MIDKLIPSFPKDKREKAKQVLHQLVAESKVTLYCHHEVSIVFKSKTSHTDAQNLHIRYDARNIRD